MPWNEAARQRYNHKTDRYQSDMTDAEWALIEPLLPPPCKRGRPRRVGLRDVLDAILHIGKEGCARRGLPKDFPAFTTVRNRFCAWSRSGVLDRVCDCLAERVRLREGRSAEPTAGIIDSQSVPTLASGPDACGWDGGKKVKGRKRHLAVDAVGNPLAALVHPADVQDRNGAVPVLLKLHDERRTVRTVFADGGYGGPKLAGALEEAGCPITVEVVKKDSDAKGFEALPRRWVVERSFGWLTRSRRLVKDFERTIGSALAWIRLAFIRLFMRRLTRDQVLECT